MNPFIETENSWQRHVREMIEGLVIARDDDFWFNEWELGFLESMEKKLRMKCIDVSTSQYEKICDLAERAGV